MIGQVIGNFKIVSRIGRGGMGEVFLAEHVAMAENRVAVKILHEDISRDHEQVQRFFNEARAVGRIKHAGILKIFDSGMFDDHAYLIMELLEGESLAARLERVGRMSTADLGAIGRQIASVLEATHRAGITHRDLKPDNIFIVRDEEVGERVKILDFGIAKLTGTLASSGPKTQGTMGTPAYMAPEQWGDSAQVDWRADVYSLGCVAYEMACGTPPFVAKNIAEAYARHLHDVPPLVRTIAPELSADCETLIARLLAKKPDERGASMAEIVAAFDAIAGGSPIRRAATAPPIAPPRDPVPVSATTLGASASELTGYHAPPRPNRRGMLIAIGVGVVVVGGGIFAATRGGGHDAAAIDAAVVVAKATPDAAIAIDAAAPDAPARPAMITLRIESEPTGAEVYRVTDSVLIGRTPLSLPPMMPEPGELALLVKKPGFRDERITLPLAADLTQRVALTGLHAPKPPVTPVTPVTIVKPPPTTPLPPHVQPDAPPGRKKGDLSGNPYGD